MNALRTLFLDDSPRRHAAFKLNRIGWELVQAWDADEAIEALQTEARFDVAYLDHDLSAEAAAGCAPEDERTGLHVAEFIASMQAEKRPRFVVVHSMNYDGALRMIAVLVDADVPCSRVPFHVHL